MVDVAHSRLNVVGDLMSSNHLLGRVGSKYGKLDPSTTILSNLTASAKTIAHMELTRSRLSAGPRKNVSPLDLETKCRKVRFRGVKGLWAV